MTGSSPARAHRYHRWEGQLSRGRWTWVAIVSSGVRLALKQNRTRLVVITAGAVMLGTCIVLYVLSLLENLAGTEQAKGYYDFVRAFLHVDVSGAARIEEYREVLWRSLYLVTIRMQLLWVLVVVAQVGPGLIAKDLKTKALPIYFAKPVTPITYVAGKWLVVASFIAAVMLLPNLLSLIIGTLVTGGLHTWGQTLGLGADLVLSGLGVCALAGATILALSSFTSDQRYVAVGWLAVCVIPSLAQQVIDQALPADATTGWLGCISLRDNIVVTTERLLGIREAWEESSLSVEAFRAALFKPVDASRAAIVLSVWTVGAFFICYRRVVRFARSAANV